MISHHTKSITIQRAASYAISGGISAFMNAVVRLAVSQTSTVSRTSAIFFANGRKGPGIFPTPFRNAHANPLRTQLNQPSDFDELSFL
jgi:hypothetical protein